MSEAARTPPIARPTVVSNKLAVVEVRVKSMVGMKFKISCTIPWLRITRAVLSASTALAPQPFLAPCQLPLKETVKDWADLELPNPFDTG